ncbi:TIGR03086 family metal-binding protein [Propionibacteriaceae bacterium Y2011]|uniref:TIGR03086 family metal-binding protein n=1 Tax=Microlunatus sp. Y2014 TaxID=3418488 RepID=UPI003B44B980
MSTDPAAEYREVAATFTARVDGVPADGWDVPTPVAEWQARDVVAHLIEWLPQVLGAPVADVPSVADDPAAAWHAHTAGVQQLLDDPERSAAPVSNPHFGEMSTAQVIDMIYTPDVFLHTWDLARATGQDDRLDPVRLAAGHAASQQSEEAMRSSGQFGPRVPVPADADLQDQVIGFIGRDPAWQPPTR